MNKTKKEPTKPKRMNETKKQQKKQKNKEQSKKPCGGLLTGAGSLLMYVFPLSSSSTFVAPTIHPASSCLQGWGGHWVSSLLSSSFQSSVMPLPLPCRC
jgi:hypothetical protein